jgi:hypothetical protein
MGAFPNVICVISSYVPAGHNTSRLFALGAGDNLARDVGLVSLVEHVEFVVDDEVGKIDFLIGGQAHLLNAESFSAGDAGHAAHNLLNISRLGAVVPGSSHLPIQLLNVFHSPGSIVGRNGTRLSDGVDVAHVVNGWWGRRVEGLQVSENVLSAE